MTSSKLDNGVTTNKTHNRVKITFTTRNILDPKEFPHSQPVGYTELEHEFSKIFSCNLDISLTEAKITLVHSSIFFFHYKVNLIYLRVILIQSSLFVQSDLCLDRRLVLINFILSLIVLHLFLQRTCKNI